VTRSAEADDEIGAWDEFVALHGDDPDLGRRREVAWTLLTKAGVLAWELGQPEEAIAVWNEVVARFQGSADEYLRWAVRYALHKKALALIELGRRREAVTVYRYAAAVSAPSRNRGAHALVAYAIAAAVSLAVWLNLGGLAARLAERVSHWLPDSHPAKR
jgi:tetratricopeptide (TPR) repeat protein